MLLPCNLNLNFSDWQISTNLSFVVYELRILDSRKVRLDSIIRPVLKKYFSWKFVKNWNFLHLLYFKTKYIGKIRIWAKFGLMAKQFFFVFAGFWKLDLLNNQSTKTFLYFKPPWRILFSVVKPTIGVFEPIFETTFLNNLFSIISYCKASTTSMDALTNLTPASGIH